MAVFSLDRRPRVLADGQAGRTSAAVARKYTTSAEWVRPSDNRFRHTGAVAPRSHANNRPPFHARHDAHLRAAVARKPDRTLKERREHVGREVSIATRGHALHSQKIAFTPPASEQHHSAGRSGRGVPSAGPPGPEPE